MTGSTAVKVFFPILIALAVFILLSQSTGCGTLAGMGQDLHDLAEGTRRQLNNDKHRRKSLPYGTAHNSMD